jgi:hypothetical protein
MSVAKKKVDYFNNSGKKKESSGFAFNEQNFAYSVQGYHLGGPAGDFNGSMSRASMSVNTVFGVKRAFKKTMQESGKNPVEKRCFFLLNGDEFNQGYLTLSARTNFFTKHANEPYKFYGNLNIASTSVEFGE